MSIEEIPADELIEMTDTWHRAFSAAGCNPACHGCWEHIKVGEKFKLATINAAVAIGSTDRNTIISKEVMLCERCNPKNVEKQDEEAIEKNRKNKEEKGCFRINGKIIH